MVIYRRPDTFTGYHSINHYYIPVELRCYFVDNSSFREDGTLVNGEPPKDQYNIALVNWKGDTFYTLKYFTKKEANAGFSAIMADYPDFKKVQD